MKEVIFRKSFKKDFNRSTSRQRIAYANVLDIFRKNPWSRELRRHNLSGKYKGLESIDIAPDLRVVFMETERCFVFYYFRNHNQLYN